MGSSINHITYDNFKRLKVSIYIYKVFGYEKPLPNNKHKT